MIGHTMIAFVPAPIQIPIQIQIRIQKQSHRFGVKNTSWFPIVPFLPEKASILQAN